MPISKNENQTLLDSPSVLESYVLAARPKTWIASIAPVWIGSSMAPRINLSIFFLTLLFSLLIQIGTNYANDYFDFVKGADAHRIGPKRATQEGWIQPVAMKKAAFFILIAALFPAWLIGSWTIPLALLCAALAILYTGGPKPLAYLGLGEVFVFLFFGPIACCGTYYLQTNTVSLDSFLASIAPGALSCAILVANNLRDEVGDRQANKKTLVVRFGRLFGLFEYGFCLLLATITPIVLVLRGFSPFLLSALLFLPMIFLKVERLQLSAMMLITYTLFFYASLFL